MRTPPNWLHRTLVLLCALSIALPPEALAQNQIKHPDDTDTPLARQYASESKEMDGGAETDDPAARMEWERHAMSGYDEAARNNYLDQVTQQQNANPDLVPVAPPTSITNNTAALAFGGANFAPANGQPVWVNIGPTRADFEDNGTASIIGMDSGRARTILPHPTNENIVYLLTSGGGLWKSTDFWANPPHWVPLTDTLPTTSGGAAVFGRVPDTLYLGQGDPYDQTIPGGMMVKTTDGGATWSTPVMLGSSISTRDVKVDTSTPNDIVLVASDNGIWRSADGGATYSQVISGVVGWSLARTSAGWLAAVQPCNPALGAAKAQCAQPGQLRLSTDLGVTWSAPIINGYTGAGRTTLAVGVPGDSIVYALSANTADTAQGNVFRSTDGGQNWTALGVNSTKAPTNPNSNQPNMNLLHAQAWYNQLILVDPTDAARNTVYIGGDLSTAKTTDGGSSWRVTSNWLAQFGLPYSHADNHAAAFQTAGGKNTVMLGNDGGLFVSNDGLTTISSTRNENLTTHLFYSIAATPDFPDVVFGGLQDNGSRVKVPGSTTYNQVIGGDGVGSGWSQANSNTQVGASQQTPRRNLSNNPPNSSWMFDQIPSIAHDNFLQPTTFPRATADPTGKVFFIASTSTIRKSTDGGVTSTVIYTNSAATNTTVRSSPHQVGVSPYNINRIAFGGAGGRFAVTLDGGTNWTAYDLISMFPPGGDNGAGFQGFNYNVAWSDNNTLFVSAAAQIPGAIHVLKGTLSGSTWTFVRWDAGLPQVSVQKIVPDPTDPTNKLMYAATDLGVYRTADGGATWAQYGAGLPHVRVADIYAPPNGSYLRIATYGRGMWELPGLTFDSAKLVGDGAGADADGILDNNETGHLNVTLRNYGGTTLSNVTAAVSANTGAISFPNGNSVVFPNVAPGGVATASVLVGLAGAATSQAVSFNIAFGDPALNLPTPMTVQRSFAVNYDESTAASDDVEAAHTSWTVSGVTPAIPDFYNWERREINGTQHLWALIDSDGAAEAILTSPVLKVGSSPFSFSFTQRYSFEGPLFDGGVIEISTNGGASWTDIGGSASPGYNGTLALGGSNAIEGRPAFANLSPGYPNPVPTTVNLGTTYANQDVRIRFHFGSDVNGGAPGWELDNFVFNGLTNNPFIANTANAAQNITGKIDVRQSGYSYNPVTKLFSQTVTLTNNTGGTVAGPVSYVLDNLSSNASAVSPTGVTAANPPVGSPYFNVNLGASNAMASGQSVTLTIQFSNPTRAAITYTPRVLAGSGAR